MKVLVADDEPDLREMVATIMSLHWADGEVIQVGDGDAAVQAFYDTCPDLVILDVAMPSLNGLEALRRLRQVSDVPIIMLTVRDAELDKVRAFELGADDYLTKPFGHLELLARARAVLRRAHPGSAGLGLPPFACGELTVDFGQREVRRAGRAINLTPTEYSLLYHLVRNAGHVVAHETLLARVWGDVHGGEMDYLKVYVRRLREKVEPNPAIPWYITTERGIGYRFRAPA